MCKGLPEAGQMHVLGSHRGWAGALSRSSIYRVKDILNEKLEVVLVSFGELPQMRIEPTDTYFVMVLETGSRS